jgi:DNA-binding IclR family transcriptional regulator
MTASEGLTTVEKSLDIIEALDTYGPIGPTELADELDIHKSTAYTHLRTLDERGYVVKAENGYRLSFRFLERGGSIRNDLEIYRQARENVESLSETTGEVANLGIIEEGMGVLIYRAEGGDAVSDNAPVGSYTHLHTTAYGKAMLAALPDRRVDRIVDRHGLPKRTKHTITDRERLFERLETIRERGYAIDEEEVNPGLYCVGSAITDDEGRPIGGVSVAGPASKLDDTYARDLAKQIRNAVNRIELKIMYE